jgi:hypothetical protein
MWGCDLADLRSYPEPLIVSGGRLFGFASVTAVTLRQSLRATYQAAVRVPADAWSAIRLTRSIGNVAIASEVGLWNSRQNITSIWSFQSES